MNGEYLLDSNIIVALLEDDPEVIRRLRARPSLYMPVTALGELYFGAFKSTSFQANLQRINDLLLEVVLLDSDAGTAYEYGSIKDSLRRKGRPIPGNDIWIAATARQHSLTVATRDAHFSFIDGLKTERW
jgi:tRNA(fMet)-specific endonuclease VapC